MTRLELLKEIAYDGLIIMGKPKYAMSTNICVFEAEDERDRKKIEFCFTKLIQIYPKNTQRKIQAVLDKYPPISYEIATFIANKMQKIEDLKEQYITSCLDERKYNCKEAKECYFKVKEAAKDDRTSPSSYEILNIGRSKLVSYYNESEHQDDGNYNKSIKIVDKWLEGTANELKQFENLIFKILHEFIRSESKIVRRRPHVYTKSRAKIAPWDVAVRLREQKKREEEQKNG